VGQKQTPGGRRIVGRTAIALAALILVGVNSTVEAIVPSLAVGPLAALGGLMGGLLVFAISSLLGALGFKTLSQKTRGPRVTAWVAGTITTLFLAVMGYFVYRWMGARGVAYCAAGFAAIWAFRQWGYLLRRPGAARYAMVVVPAVALLGVGTGVGFWIAKNRQGSPRDSAIRNPQSAIGSPAIGNPQSTIHSWPMFRGNAVRTGALDNKPGPKAPLDALWAVKDPDVSVGDLSASPAVADGRVYIAGSFASVFFRGANIYCLDAQTGEIRWRFKTAQQVFSSPAVANGRVYCGEGLHSDGNSSLYCLDATSGTLLWSFQTKSHVESSPAVADDKVYFGAGDDGVYCVNATSGTQVWHYEGVHVDVPPAVEGNRVYFGTGYGENGIYCLDGQTGQKIWSLKTSHGAWGTPTVVGGDFYYAIGNGNFVESAPEGQRFGRVIRCDAATGNERWHVDLPDAVLSSIAIAGNQAYFGCRDSHVYCYDRQTGKETWKYKTGGPVVSSPVVAGDRLYVGSDDGCLYALQAAQGELETKYDTSKVTGRETRIWSSPALTGGRLFFGSSASYMFCVGHVESKPAS
jgi:outer membrane protein assembly factor BamB